MKTLRLILGDQLNSAHSWFGSPDAGTTYLMVEARQEAEYVTHHVQKLVAFFLAMRTFADGLRMAGHRVQYIRMDEPAAKKPLDTLIADLVHAEAYDRFEYQLPDEYRLDRQMADLAESLDIPVSVFDSEHFYAPREAVAQRFQGKKKWVMEFFYRDMRNRYELLMDGPDRPEGGQWNYDASNRKKWKGEPPIPPYPNLGPDGVSDILEEIEAEDLPRFGSIDPKTFNWPVERQAALQALTHFTEHLLPYFGAYQDAMKDGEPFLFHSRISFALNAKILSPKEVVDAVITRYREAAGTVPIEPVEGFVRQILGWREFIRGIYWAHMPDYATRNALDNNRPLPSWFWTGRTGMNCLAHSIGQSLEHAYAHHIQRLMVIGNFALLAGAHPDAVDAWYLGVYIDAIEWVELPNTRGMSQFADGGVVATKPYVASANYMKKMGDYCTGCRYDPKQRTGPNACPFNALYWNFLDVKRERFARNPRMGMMLRLLDKMPPAEREAIRTKAENLLERIEEL